MGDDYSWAALVGTFQRMFSGNVTDPERLASIKATTLRADLAANAQLATARDAPLHEHALAHRYAAARALLANRANVIADAVNAAPRSQPQLNRLDAEDDVTALGKGLREACRRCAMCSQTGTPTYASLHDTHMVSWSLSRVQLVGRA